MVGGGGGGEEKQLFNSEPWAGVIAKSAHHSNQ